MKILTAMLVFQVCAVTAAHAGPSISPALGFLRDQNVRTAAKTATVLPDGTASVTVRFSHPPDNNRIAELERSGLLFSRHNGTILHTERIYAATVVLDSLDSLRNAEDIVRIESTWRPSTSPTLDVSNPQVQASLAWSYPALHGGFDGTGITVTNVDTGIDIFHPGFFKPDGGEYRWIDLNRSGRFDPGIDGVDLNGNGELDTDEILSFFDTSFSDPLGLIIRFNGLYEADIDWLYNDRNRNGVRDYGSLKGYSDNDPCFGELLFAIDDRNNNNALDPGETLIALGTSRIKAVLDKNGYHYRGENLLSVIGDTANHGTGSSGIVGGQFPGRRFTGMAPGVEFIAIDRNGLNIEEALIWARHEGTDIIQYEFASWVYEFLDGTSNLEVLISDLYKDGIHQFTASGNLAGPTRKKHARITIPRSSTKSFPFTVPNIGVTRVYVSLIWRDTNLSPRLYLTLPDKTATLITGDELNHRFGALSVISGKDISTKSTNRMDILIMSDLPFNGDFVLSMTNRRNLDITIDGYIADDKTQWMHGTQFTNYVTDDGTVCSPGTAEKGVTVGAYDPRGTRNIRGGINDFSSRGKTIDGRRAVDITAPGTLVYSLTSSYAVGGQPGGYIDFGGTSAALPHVTGCVALLLQSEPTLSPDAVADILFRGALTDSFTGLTPNDIWGYGKLRVYDSLLTTDIITSASSEPAPNTFTVSDAFPNPFNSTLRFTVTYLTERDSGLEFGVYNILGQKIYTSTYSPAFTDERMIAWNGIDANGHTVSNGTYLFSFKLGDTILHRRAVYVK